MTEIFADEVIYSLPSAINLDQTMADKHLVICRKSDLANQGITKLSEILSAINWEKGNNLELKELEDKEVVQLSSGLLKNHKRIVISFGLSPIELGLQTPLQYYHPFVFENAIVIFSHAVQELINNKQHKANLWNTIKNFKA